MRLSQLNLWSLKPPLVAYMRSFTTIEALEAARLKVPAHLFGSREVPDTPAPAASTSLISSRKVKRRFRERTKLHTASPPTSSAPSSPPHSYPDNSPPRKRDGRSMLGRGVRFRRMRARVWRRGRCAEWRGREERGGGGGCGNEGESARSRRKVSELGARSESERSVGCWPKQPRQRESSARQSRMDEIPQAKKRRVGQ
ncbi:hypothetical protein BJY59DRAFT_481829 [Rhodotorula toruloides]